MKRHQQIITTTTFSTRKRKILFAFQLRITLKALTEINLASGHTKEDKNKEKLIILTKKSFVEAFILTIVKRLNHYGMVWLRLMVTTQ